MNDAFVFPLSHAQERLWFLDQMMPGNPFYTLSIATRLGSRIEPRLLREVINEIVRRHESLRTTFRTIEGNPYQVVAPTLTLDVPVIDLRDFSKSESEIEAHRLAGIDAGTPFDLESGPLLRVKLLQLSDNEFALLLAMHHIISDGWSMGILFKELSLLYESFARGKPSPLTPLSLQYADYAVWQREWLRDDVLDEQIAYWRKTLANHETLELPCDHQRPRAQSFRGAIESIKLGVPVSDSLKKLCRSEGVTLFMGLLALFNAVLLRWTGQKDIVVGSPMAGRDRVEFEPLIGFFINSVVLRTHLSNRPSFRQLLGRVQTTVIEAFAHGDLPFGKLVEELHPERDLSRNPLYQVAFQFMDIPTINRGANHGAANDHGAAALSIEAERGTAMFDLSLTIAEFPDGLRGQFEYSADLFDATTIQQLASAMICLAEAAVKDPDRAIDTLPTYTPRDRERWVVEWNSTQKNHATLCLHNLFQDQAAKSPDATAVRVAEKGYTYAELDHASNRLAQYLMVMGVGPDRPIGICLERSLDHVISMLAILKAGGAFLPLDPAYPVSWLTTVLADSSTPLLLTTSEIANRFPDFTGKIVSIDLVREEVDNLPEEMPAVVITPAHLAYIIYTSGSTGSPKGVAVSHGAISNHMQWLQRRFPLTPQDRLLQKTPLSFDASILELHASFLAGAELVLAPHDSHRDSSEILRAIQEHEITAIQLVPAQLEALLNEPNIAVAARSLRLVFCGGEVLPNRLVRQCHDWLDVEMINLYGPTEASIDATFRLCRDEAGDDGSAPIGRPIDNVQAYVLDDRLQPVLPGTTGELYLGGAGLARAYWNNPSLTAESFIPDPFSNHAGARLFRTGDLVRMCPNGELAFLRRCDSQVKLRGYRIELGEIESVLSQHDNVSECAAVVREDTPGDQRLVAYAVGNGKLNSRPNGHTGAYLNGSGESLRRYLQERLPSQMVPSLIVPLEEIPKLSNGKLNRKMLPQPGLRIEAVRKPHPPKTNLEHVLSGLWTEVLKTHDEVSINDDFFADLGGHSLLATQLISRVREVFQTQTPLRQVFESPTVEGFAEALLASTNGGPDLEETAGMLLELSNLSDEEVEELL